MELRSTDGATLVAVTSDITGEVTMRSPRTEGRTRQSHSARGGHDGEARPGGYRFVLTGLRRPLKLGDRVELVLTIEAADGTRQDIRASAEVRGAHRPTTIDVDMRTERRRARVPLDGPLGKQYCAGTYSTARVRRTRLSSRPQAAIGRGRRPTSRHYRRDRAAAKSALACAPSGEVHRSSTPALTFLRQFGRSRSVPGRFSAATSPDRSSACSSTSADRRRACIAMDCRRDGRIVWRVRIQPPIDGDALTHAGVGQRLSCDPALVAGRARLVLAQQAEIVPLVDVGAGPPARDRRQVVRRHACRGLGRVASGCDEIGAFAFEPKDAIRQHVRRGETLAQSVGHGTEVLADDEAARPLTFERQHAEQQIPAGSETYAPSEARAPSGTQNRRSTPIT